MSASELLSSWLMFPTPLIPDKDANRDMQSLDAYLSENGVFRRKNRNGPIRSLPLSATVFYLTPVASDGFHSTLESSVYDPNRKNGNLSVQVIAMESPTTGTAVLNPDWVE